MNLTIVQFTWGLRLGGQERVVVDLAKAFQSRGHRSIVATTLFEGELKQELVAAGVKFYGFGFQKSYNPINVPTVIRFLKRNQANVVICHGQSGALLPKLAALYLRTPVVIHVEHTLRHGKFKASSLADHLLFGHLDEIVCVSEAVRDSFLPSFRALENKTKIIHNGIDTGRFSPNGILKNGPKKVGMVANFETAKGHVYFIQAASQVARVFPHVEFILVGEGKLRKDMQLRARELGIAKQCHFLGRQSNVENILKQLDVFVLSSIVEGLPVSLLEAQYLSLPAVATTSGGIPEVISHGYNGLLVPPHDSNALAAAILSLLRNETLRAELGANAKNRILEHFSLDHSSSRYLDEMYRILHEKGYEANAPRSA